MSELKSWKPGDRVIVRLPDKRRGSGIRGGGSRDVDVHGTVREVNIPGQPPGVKVDLDREINGVRDCYATHGELRPEAGEAPSPLAGDDGIEIHDAVLPQWPAQPWTPFPNRWSDGPSLVELDAYGDFAPERSDQ